MILETDSYGEIEYEEQDLIFFPDGVFGFPDLKHYLLLSLTEGDDSILLMLATDRPEIVFAIINPLVLYPNYSPSLTPAELSFFHVEDNADLSYYTICTIRDKDDYLQNTVNLKCPLVIDPITRKGMQVILSDPSYNYRHTFSSFQAVAEASNMQREERQDADTETQKE
ncbi:MAG: flagellar assembly protein FliW [Lachnospiraceae bacterium]|nr:flagellar assembly protein FliW [Lachnospiraceae bacterium]